MREFRASFDRPGLFGVSKASEARVSELGFSLVEVIVVALIVGVLASLAMYAGNNIQRRERVNSVAMSLYGWLNEVRQSSLRLQGSGCTIKFESGSRAVGQILASVDSQATPACSSMLGANDELALARDLTNGLGITLTPSAASLSFTPRTLSTNTVDLTIAIVVNGTAPQRCIRISAISGFIQIGRNDSSATTSGACTYTTSRSL